jgi:histidinol-phosphate phosphatase family protein
MKAIFLDRDGTINAGIPKYERVDSIDKVEILPGAIEGLKVLAGLGVSLFFVTNQAGLAEGRITRADFDEINQKIIDDSGAVIKETFVCPHGEGSDCDCRKPKPGMLHDAASKYGIDLHESWMIGDRQTDIDTGINAGTKTILVKSGSATESPNATFVAEDLLDAASYIAAHL